MCSKYHIGTALSYILAWAKNGSAWLVEPAISVHQIPRLIHFPEKEGGQVDPKVYQAQVKSIPFQTFISIYVAFLFFFFSSLTHLIAR